MFTLHDACWPYSGISCHSSLLLLDLISTTWIRFRKRVNLPGFDAISDKKHWLFKNIHPWVWRLRHCVFVLSVVVPSFDHRLVKSEIVPYPNRLWYLSRCMRDILNTSYSAMEYLPINYWPIEIFGRIEWTVCPRYILCYWCGRCFLVFPKIKHFVLKVAWLLLPLLLSLTFLLVLQGDIHESWQNYFQSIFLELGIQNANQLYK
jgi:hypothetical protein